MKLPNLLEAKKRTKNKVEILNYNLEEKYKNLGKNKTYYIRTYGCQMNEHDSENIKGILESVGFTLSSSFEKADLIVLNTCAIRENVHDKVYGLMGRIKHLKKEKEVIACISGCMAQEEVVVNDILEKYNYIDIVFGTHNIHMLLEYIYQKYNQNIKQNIEVYSIEGNIVENMPSVLDSKYKAWVNIMLGCDKFCTYCIVPYTRGKQRSREYQSIIKEVEELKENGYKEITLLGQNVNAYGKDLYQDYDLSNLLLDVSKTGIDRIRFVTSHPWDFTDSMIDVISKCDNIMPYIHLPLQSGSDRILKLMGRRYKIEEYLELYKKLREKIDNSSITTDIIAGFPGETEEDFLKTLEVVEKCKFDGAFTFIYSPRIGTPAAKMDNQIEEEIKEERLQRLNEIINKYSLESNKKQLKKQVKVLVEGKSSKGTNMYMGYTENMKLVNFESTQELVGKIIELEIIDAKSFSLTGKVLN